MPVSHRVAEMRSVNDSSFSAEQICQMLILTYYQTRFCESPDYVESSESELRIEMISITITVNTQSERIWSPILLSVEGPCLLCKLNRCKWIGITMDHSEIESLSICKYVNSDMNCNSYEIAVSLSRLNLPRCRTRYRRDHWLIEWPLKVNRCEWSTLAGTGALVKKPKLKREPKICWPNWNVAADLSVCKRTIERQLRMTEISGLWMVSEGTGVLAIVYLHVTYPKTQFPYLHRPRSMQTSSLFEFSILMTRDSLGERRYRWLN